VSDVQSRDADPSPVIGRQAGISLRDWLDEEDKTKAGFTWQLT